LSVKGCQRDIVILDVNSKDVTLGMSCPPAAFVDAEFLKSVDHILKPTGKLWQFIGLLLFRSFS